MAQTMVQVLKQAGDNLTRVNVMKEAAKLDMTLLMLYPGIKVNTSAIDFYALEGMQMLKFNSSGFDLVGNVIGE